MADLKLDFIITPTYSSKTIAITDTSVYPTNPPEVEAPTLEVSIPGFYTVNIPFVPEELNLLTSTVLGITEEGEEPLPDGVYIFKYSVTPSYTNFVEKSIMVVDQLQEKFDNAFMKLDMMRVGGDLKKQEKISLDTIYYFIQGAIAAANNCATDEAIKLYKRADKLLYDFTERGVCCSTILPSNFY
jgi:hypothetical protein